MKTKLIAAAAMTALLACSARAQTPSTPKSDSGMTPGCNNKIPDKIMTPDKVETRIGTLQFFDGMPSAASTEKVYDYLDMARGVETFLNGIPATSIEAVRLGWLEMGAKSCNDVVVFNQLLDSSPLFLTGNTETVYVLGFLDLKKDGPTVVEVPPKCGPGTLDDAFFRFVVDMGAPGPDRGAGGKYLILPPDYTRGRQTHRRDRASRVGGQKYLSPNLPAT